MSKKKGILFLLAVIALFTFMTYQSRKGYMQDSGFFNSILDRSHSIVKTASEWIRSPFEKIALRDEENRALKKQIDELLLERMKYQEAVIENKRLRELLKLQETNPEGMTSAKVIARGVSQWAHTMVVDKGLKDGVVKDSAAITPKGLAGKIFLVSDAFSDLLLLTDINFSAAVRLQESRKEGIVSGTGTGRIILKYIPPEDEVKAGDIVITSGLDRLFPPGITVGYVSKVDRQGNSQFQYIDVIPYVNTSQIEEVLIVR